MKAKQASFVYSTAPNYYTEPFRPQYHLSPEQGNLSDPNGMVYFEGEYHQFYQNGGQWGHAVSLDLLHWQHLPVAIPKDMNNDAWSGSAVVDAHDTSGFFGGKSGLVAVYTNFNNGLQSQSLAYSSDRGRTWVKYAGNPVIPNPGLKDFRDPKVIWYEPAKQWVMVVSVNDHVRFYQSKNLKQWKMTGEFGLGEGSHAAVWECPDLFQLPVEGTDRNRWILAVSIGSNSQTNGSTAQYFIGDFNGETFTNANPPGEVLWSDYGKDFYAAQSFSDIPAEDGRRIWVGWMSNWRYPFDMPTDPWKGNLSIPRVLKLRDVPGVGLRMVQEPAKELEALRGNPVTLKTDPLQKGSSDPFSGVRGTSYELDASLSVSDDAVFDIQLRKGAGQVTLLHYDARQDQLTFDRTHSDDYFFEPNFHEAFSAPVKQKDGGIKLRIFVDESSVEVFANDGEAVLSAIHFPKPTSNGLGLQVKRGQITLKSSSFYPMKPIWRDEDTNSPKPLHIVLDDKNVNIPLGKAVEAKAVVQPLRLPQHLNWSSADESVVKVNVDGQNQAKLNGIGKGETTVTVTSSDGSVHAAMDVLVY